MADFVAANGTIVKSAYQPGSLLSGTVSGVMDFGVFLNLEGGGSGLLHRSSISAMPIPRLSDVFHVNQTIKVVIQSLDPASGRCGLETKSLERRPGDVADNITRAMEHAEETFNT
jgi:ribosomal protein S1